MCEGKKKNKFSTVEKEGCPSTIQNLVACLHSQIIFALLSATYNPPSYRMAPIEFRIRIMCDTQCLGFHTRVEDQRPCVLTPALDELKGSQERQHCFSPESLQGRQGVQIYQLTSQEVKHNRNLWSDQMKDSIVDICDGCNLPTLCHFKVWNPNLSMHGAGKAKTSYSAPLKFPEDSTRQWI